MNWATCESSGNQRVTRLAADRTASPERFALDRIPLRWPIPGGVAIVSSWRAKPGDPIAAGDTVLRVSLPNGELWDYHVVDLGRAP